MTLVSRSAEVLRTARPARLRAQRAALGLAQHVTMRLADSRVIAPTPGALRLAAVTLLEIGSRHGLLNFHVVDTHAHVLLLTTREDGGVFARRAEVALGARLQLGCPFDPARFTAVHDQMRLGNTFYYILRQPRHHGIATDPFHDGSALADLIGLRVVDVTVVERVRARLPRVDLDHLAREHLSGAADVTPIADLLADAAAAAFGLPDLSGQTRRVVAARNAAVRAGEAEGLRPGAVSAAIGLTRRRGEQLRAGAVASAEHVRAVRWQLRLRSAGRRPPG